jgi:hypothetical protein
MSIKLYDEIKIFYAPVVLRYLFSVYAQSLLFPGEG